MENRENIFTVSEVNSHFKNVVENNIPNLLVEGEISNFTHHRSGHIYFSLKDNNSTLRCVFFKYANKSLNFQPKVGDNVICGGKLTVYVKGGSYQLNVKKMLPSGIGELQLKFEELKKKLMGEGLFDEKLKKQIPKFPESIGVVTSSTGAAIEDIKNVITRRYPVKIFLYPANVQGEKAAKDIIDGINYFKREKPVDLIIIGRGGGSQEDLFCFNDEKLARTIFEVDIPIISAVGHEIDFTISDFVSDLRAPTPSAAAELAVPNKTDILNHLRSLRNSLRASINQFFYSKKLEIQELENRLDSFHPKNLVADMHKRLDNAILRLISSTKVQVNRYKKRSELLSNELRELSPHQALKRGYSLIRKEKKLINSITQISKDEELEIILSDGKCNAKVKEIKEHE